MQIQDRNQKGIDIVSQGNSITKLGKYNYQVMSQSQDKTYNVRKLQDADIWTFADFTYRLVRKSHANLPVSDFVTVTLSVDQS